MDTPIKSKIPTLAWTLSSLQFRCARHLYLLGLLEW